MSSHLQQILDNSTGLIAINPRFDKLISSLKSAVFDDRGNPLANKIYGNTLIDKTRETFKEVRNNESTKLFQLSKLVDIYYKRVKEGRSQLRN
ncbi:MAG: hypothetical protein K0S93_351 [Nitrososphaeraceae archaeon]|jgi:hypothetical protein|nr:hypothetical protein [Nitrososphaeraceae archaeon]